MLTFSSDLPETFTHLHWTLKKSSPYVKSEVWSHSMKMGSTLLTDDHIIIINIFFFCCLKKLIINIAICWEIIKKNDTLSRKTKANLFSAQFLLLSAEHKKINITEDWAQVSCAKSHRKPVVTTPLRSGHASSYLASISPEKLHMKHIQSWDGQPTHEKH